MNKTLFKKAVKKLGNQASLARYLNVSRQFITSVKNGRKNILATIPVVEKKTDNYGEVSYSANYPNYINLTNKNAINLRNIRARIISDRYEPLITEGLSQITLLLQEHC